MGICIGCAHSSSVTLKASDVQSAAIAALVEIQDRTGAHDTVHVSDRYLCLLQVHYHGRIHSCIVIVAVTTGDSVWWKAQPSSQGCFHTGHPWTFPQFEGDGGVLHDRPL